MAPKYHPTPLSGGDRKALNKELGKARAMANILAVQSAEVRAKAETMLRQADKPPCEKGERGGVFGRRADRSLTDDRPGHQCGLRMARNPLPAMQDAERRRS